MSNDLDYGYGGSVSTENEHFNEGPDEKILLWDSFKCTEPQPRSGSMVEKRWYELTLRIIKAILYLILFVLILGGSVVSKGTLLFATSQISGRAVPYCDYYPGRNAREPYRFVATLPKESRTPWMWCIILAFAIPEFLEFLRFLWNCFFFDLKIPNGKYLLFMSIFEIVHVTGLAMLFFIVLPDFDVMQAAASLTCVCIVPNVLGFLSRFKNRQNADEYRYYMYGDIICLILQLCGMTSFTYIAFQNENALAPWILPVALLLSSVRWWSNYVTNDSRFEFIKYLAEVRANLQLYRPILIGYTAVLRTLTFLTISILMAYWRGYEPKTFFDGFFMKEYNVTINHVNTSSFENSEVVFPAEQEGFFVADRWIPVYVVAIHAFASLCVYNCSKFACKTLMQGFGFAFPLNMTVPITVLGLMILDILRNRDVCMFHNNGLFAIPDHLFFNTWNTHATWYGWLWVIWLLSQAWITMHIWTMRNERLASTDRIFAVWSYDALIVDQSVALSRWREEPEDDYYMEKEEDVEEPVKDVDMSSVKKQDHVTRIYACATMWHETAEEMTDFLNSILRLDRDQCIMRILRKRYRITSPDYYELEVHIFFDDALKCVHGCNVRCTHDENKTEVNDYVVDFVKSVEKCIRARNLRPTPPIKYPTPYGGRLVWILPEKTKMYVHLKDKNKIRTRKRWSQVMYMYYLLGYRLMELPIEVERKEVIAENTYILTLDGDIDFRPSAVRTLIDRMRINKDLGSACGRIHPLGRGPLVWFQKFEYAIGHWLQKSTEHTIGCVLCSPGCFALFRAKALMDYNVMRKYATVPTEARHFIQYDQGEDRWLCTLILQMGYKVEYSAASDAYTHAPETFNEFFIQRRRWIPSTVANIFDLLETASETKKNNRDISWLYICYQWILMGSTVIGPGTIFLMLVGAFVAAFRIENWTSFGYNLIPIFIFCIVCFFCKEKTQLLIAGIITAIYGLVMVVVLVGIMIQIAEDGWLAPSTLFFFIVTGELVTTGLLHPLEWTCLLYGVIYYVTVPSMYLLLIIFSLFNMNNVSWGTRGAPKTLTTTSEEQQTGTKSNKIGNKMIGNMKNEKGPIEFSITGLFKCILCAQEVPRENDSQLKDISASLSRIESRLDEVERSIDNGSHTTRDLNPAIHRAEVREDSSNPSARAVNGIAIAGGRGNATIEDQDDKNDSDFSTVIDSDTDDVGSIDDDSVNDGDNFLVAPNWLHSKDLGKSEVEYLKSEEEVFWKQFISTYLDPIDKDEKREAEIAKQITNLRDQYIFKFFMINALFVLIVFLMQLNKDLLHIQWPLGIKYNVTYDNTKKEVYIYKQYLRLEPIGCLFILGFLTILFIQFIAMLFHRFETFSHIMAKVQLNWYCCDKKTDLSEEAMIEKHAEKVICELQRQIDNDMRTGAVHNSALPPRKRKTIKQTIDGNARNAPYAVSFSSALQKNLEESGQSGSGKGFISTRMSQTALRALQRRRTTILNEQSQSKRNEMDNIYASANNSFKKKMQRRPTGVLQAYENPSFDPDEELSMTMNDRTK